MHTERLTAALEGRYRIERQLGMGGMATVYLAADLKHERKVALKVLKPELAAVLGAERFVVEIKTTAALSHPHILPLFDSGSADGFLYYVMPFIEGETLRDKLNRETQLGVDEAVRITREVADALDYAHRHGVIHRDIKPENILLHDGRPMVADFGIALAVSAAAGGRMTETGLSLGTPHYMSPEQATAEKEITARSDVYSLGSVLYEMLSGNPPHVGASAQQIIMKIITESAAPVTQFRKTVPPHVAAAVAKSLEKLPADRFESAKAFADALGNTAFTTATVSTGDAVTATNARALRSRPFLAAASLAAVATIAAVWGWMRPAPLREVSRFTIQLSDSQPLSPAGTAWRVALSPDGRTMAYVSGGGVGALGGSRLVVRPMDALEATTLPGTENAANPAFSPDGKRIAFVTLASPRALKVINLSGGPPITLTDSLVDLGGVSWGYDGYIYYDGHLEGDGVARIRETGGQPPEVASRPDTAAGEVYHNAPEPLPNGRGVLFSISRGNQAAVRDIGVLDLRTGTHKVLTRGFMARYSHTGHLVYVTDGGALMAAPFDADRLELTGDAVAIADGVATLGTRVDLVLSTTGALAYAAGGVFGSRRELVWVSRDGQVSPVDPEWRGEIGARPTLSPDGLRVALALGQPGTRQLFVKQLDQGPLQRVTTQASAPTWSPDGKFLAYTGPSGLRRVPSDGSGPPERVTTAGGSPEYSRDGTWLVFQRAADIVGLRTGGDTTPVVLVSDPDGQSAPALSPDGRWIAYTSNETGNFHVYVRPFPDTRAARHQVSVSGGIFSRWSRAGNELFFVDPVGIQLMSVTVTPGPRFDASVPKPLFSLAPMMPLGFTFFDVHPDGRRFLFTRGDGAGTTAGDRLVLVQNFDEELRAKVGRGR